MARGWPDYSSAVGLSQERQFLTMLTSAPVWFEDKFESPLLKWQQVRGTVNLYCNTSGALVDSVVYTGSACLSLYTAVADFAHAGRSIGLPPLSYRVGIEINLRFGDSAVDYSAVAGETQLIMAYFQTLTDFKSYLISYVPSTGMWYLSSDNGVTWTYVLTHDLFVATNHVLKLVIDPTNDMYDKIYINNVMYDLSAYAGYSLAGAAATYFLVSVRVEATALRRVHLYIDNFKVTYNEI